MTQVPWNPTVWLSNKIVFLSNLLLVYFCGLKISAKTFSTSGKFTFCVRRRTKKDWLMWINGMPNRLELIYVKKVNYVGCSDLFQYFSRSFLNLIVNCLLLFIGVALRGRFVGWSSNSLMYFWHNFISFKKDKMLSLLVF